MINLRFPVSFTFKIGTLANDFVAHDANNAVIAYVRQKMFNLKEDIEVFDNEYDKNIIYRIKADRWLDFSAAYSFYDGNNKELGKIVRKGWKSIWRSAYEIIDENRFRQYTINEERVFVRIMDSFLGEIPIINIFTGYILNPSYIVKDLQNQIIVRLTKKPSFWGRKFEIYKVGETDSDDDYRILLGLMMMILLERRRG
jgi:hypothetical protein